MFLLGWIVLLFGCVRLQASKELGHAQQEIAAAEAKKQQEATLRKIASEAPPREGSYRIAPNDVMDIRVFGAPEWNATVRVDAEGIIRFPPIGEVKVVGRTERELETYLQDQLREKNLLKKPQVTVRVTETHPSEVYLFGAVRTPGRYPLVGEMHLLDLLATAGGIAAGAGTTAYVIRYSPTKPSSETPTQSSSGSTDQRITIDLDGLLLKGEPEWNIALWPGDVVNVPVPDPGWVHVTGPGVVTPGTYPLITYLGLQGREVSPSGAQSLVPYPLTRSSKSLSQAIDEAGGLKFEASKRIRILRTGEDGRRQYIRVNYNEIQRDSRNDVPLQTRDTVIVKRNIPKFVVYILGRVFQDVVRFSIYANYDLFNENTRSTGGGGGGGNVRLIPE